jgi:predicted nucleic acid-binding protein
MTMRVKLYLDTSVLGAVTDPGPEDRIAATRRLFARLVAGRWDGFVSTLVLFEVDRAAEPIRRKIGEELARIPVTVLEETGDTIELARAYIMAGAIPADAENDARHIAIAALNDIPVVVSWNFRHMVNIERKRRINSVNVREALPLLDIVSPWEVGDEEG